MKRLVINFFGKTTFLVFPLFVGPLMLHAAPPAGSSDAEKGSEIFHTMDRMDEGYHDASVEMEMVLVNAAGEESHRLMHFSSFEVRDDGDKTLITFRHPRDIQGTGLLSFEHIDREDDQWLYLPALKRVKRIASKNKSGSFVGSEFSYEDISSNEPEKYDYKYLREETHNGAAVWVVERYPKDPNSGYTRIISWVDQSNHQIVKQEFYDRKNSLLKAQTVTGIKQHLDKFWRPSEILMVNRQTKKQTLLKFTEWRFKQGLEESFFTKRSLERQR